MQVIGWQDKERWNEIIRTFAGWNVYFLNEYAVSFMLHGDGEPMLFYFEDGRMRMAYVMMYNDLAKEPVFCGLLPEGSYADLTTPYGYGGPLADGDINDSSVRFFMEEMERYCIENNIVSQFFRFCPWLSNHRVMEGACRLVSLKNTVFMDTRKDVDIMGNMDTKNRNMVRKAAKSGVTIEQDTGERLAAFVDIYEETMKRDRAEQYYFFGPEYYAYLKEQMAQNIRFFYALRDKEIISCAIVLYNENDAHYHLSGMRTNARQYASMNLLLYETACWAQKKGLKLFHLGGGVSGEDSLFGFKKQFHKNGQLPFFIGSNVFLPGKFEELIRIRKETHPEWNDKNPFMIKYRGG